MSDFFDLLEQWCEEEKKLHEEYKLQRNLDMCGTWRHKFNAVTGLTFCIRHYCNQYRHCARCNKRYAAKWRQCLVNVGQLFYTMIPETEWKSQTRKWNRLGITWRQWPDQGCRFVVLGEQVEGSIALLPSFWKEASDFGDANCDEELCIGNLLKRIPRNKRPGGKLGTTPKRTPTDKEADVILVKAIAHDGTKKQNDTALAAAMEETKHLDPHNAKDLQAAMDERQDAYIKHLKLLGVKITHISRQKVRVRSDTVNWRQDTVSEGRSRLKPEQMKLPLWVVLGYESPREYAQTL